MHHVTQVVAIISQRLSIRERPFNPVAFNHSPMTRDRRVQIIRARVPSDDLYPWLLFCLLFYCLRLILLLLNLSSILGTSDELALSRYTVDAFSFFRFFLSFVIFILLFLFIMCVHPHFWSVKRCVTEKRRTCFRISFWSIVCLCASFVCFIFLFRFDSNGVLLEEVFKKE
jgi:hypothetical protein